MLSSATLRNVTLGKKWWPFEKKVSSRKTLDRQQVEHMKFCTIISRMLTHWCFFSSGTPRWSVCPGTSRMFGNISTNSHVYIGGLPSWQTTKLKVGEIIFFLTTWLMKEGKQMEWHCIPLLWTRVTHFLSLSLSLSLSGALSEWICLIDGGASLFRSLFCQTRSVWLPGNRLARLWGHVSGTKLGRSLFMKPCITSHRFIFWALECPICLYTNFW